MKFKSSVQNNRVAWPTHRKFKRDEWTRLATRMVEDDEDSNLAELGLWVAEILEPLREKFFGSPIWEGSFESVSRYFISIANHDLFLATRDFFSQGSDAEVVPIQFVAKTKVQPSIEGVGPSELEALLEQGVDVLELCLFLCKTMPKELSPLDVSDVLAALKEMQVYGSIYHFTEEVFHRAVWLDLQINRKEDVWLLYPKRLVDELLWTASHWRFDSLIAEFVPRLSELMNEDSVIRDSLKSEYGGVPEFILTNLNGIVEVDVRLAPMADSKVIPKVLVYEFIAKELYHIPLLLESLPALNGGNVLAVVRVWCLLGAIADEILKSISTSSTKGGFANLEELNQFCPIVMAASLTESVSKATKFDAEYVKNIISGFVWSPTNTSGQSLWFRPLIEVNTEKGVGYYFTLNPLSVGNIYRCVDNWLTTFGLSLDQRGKLFQDEIATELIHAANAGSMNDQFVVSRPGVTLVSSDGISQEEFDILMLLNDLVVIGEAKCQQYPSSALERANYLRRLNQEATTQVSRKAEWARHNLDSIAMGLNVERARLSGNVVSMVISNHPFGMGNPSQSVAIVDLWMLTRYLSAPYVSDGIYTPEIGLVEHEGPPFYQNERELADNFDYVMKNPPNMLFYISNLEQNFSPIPLRIFQQEHTLVFRYLAKSAPQVNT